MWLLFLLNRTRLFFFIAVLELGGGLDRKTNTVLGWTPRSVVGGALQTTSTWRWVVCSSRVLPLVRCFWLSLVLEQDVGRHGYFLGRLGLLLKRARPGTQRTWSRLVREVDQADRERQVRSCQILRRSFGPSCLRHQHSRALLAILISTVCVLVQCASGRNEDCTSVRLTFPVIVGKVGNYVSRTTETTAEPSWTQQNNGNADLNHEPNQRGSRTPAATPAGTTILNHEQQRLRHFSHPTN